MAQGLYQSPARGSLGEGEGWLWVWGTGFWEGSTDMHLCCRWGGQTHRRTKTGDSARHGPHMHAHTHTHPDIDMEAEKGSRKEAEKGRGGRGVGLRLGDLDKGPVAF